MDDLISDGKGIRFGILALEIQSNGCFNIFAAERSRLKSKLDNLS